MRPPIGEGARFEGVVGAEHPEIERVTGGAEEVGVERQHLLDHAIDDEADLGRRVRLVRQDVVAEQRQPVDRVIEVGGSRQRQDITRHLLRPLLNGIRHPLRRGFALCLGTGGEDAGIVALEVRRQELGQAAVPLQTPLDRRAVDRERRFGQVRGDHHVAGDLAVPLRDLLGVVEGVGVEERPDRQPRDVVEDEDEGGVLKRRVVPGRKQIGVQLQRPLPPRGPISGFIRAQPVRRRFGDELQDILDLRRSRPIAGPGRRNRQREWMARRFVPQQYDGRRGRNERREGSDSLVW